MPAPPARDPSGSILWNLDPLVTALLCLVKGAAAGWAAGAIYNLVARSGRGGPAERAGAALRARRRALREALQRGRRLRGGGQPRGQHGHLLARGSISSSTILSTSGCPAWVADSGNAANPLLYVFLGLAGVNFVIGARPQPCPLAGDKPRHLRAAQGGHLICCSR